MCTIERKLLAQATHKNPDQMAGMNAILLCINVSTWEFLRLIKFNFAHYCVLIHLLKCFNECKLIRSNARCISKQIWIQHENGKWFWLEAEKRNCLKRKMIIAIIFHVCYSNKLNLVCVYTFRVVRVFLYIWKASSQKLHVKCIIKKNWLQFTPESQLGTRTRMRKRPNHSSEGMNGLMLPIANGALAKNLFIFIINDIQAKSVDGKQSNRTRHTFLPKCWICKRVLIEHKR